MSTLNITLLQQPLVWLDGPANLGHFDAELETVRGNDLIVLPEMFTTGFAMNAAGKGLSQSVVETWLQEWAKETNALIGGSIAVSTPKGAVNRFLLVSPLGDVYQYDKRHLFRTSIHRRRCWRAMPLSSPSSSITHGHTRARQTAC